MDAHAHLISLGWAGPGHSLDSAPLLQRKGRHGLAYDSSQKTNTGRGLVKPLLISQKKNSFGVGKKAHEPAAGNDWWLKGFENALSNIGKDRGREGTSGTATPESTNCAAYAGKHSGLYGFFVKGQEMKGTIREDAWENSRGRKRKSDAFDNDQHVSASSSTITPVRRISQEKHKSKSEAVADFEQISQFLTLMDKDQKRGERKATADPTQEFEQMGHLFEAGLPKEKATKDGMDGETCNITPEVGQKLKGKMGLGRKEAKVKNPSMPSQLPEKEQRRQRRRAAKAAAESDASEETALSSAIRSTQVPGFQADAMVSAHEALRGAGRKTQKGKNRPAKPQTNG